MLGVLTDQTQASAREMLAASRQDKWQRLPEP
jgi:hypothetical protein